MLTGGQNHGCDQSDVLGEREERVFAGAFCDKITGSGWGFDRQSGENDEKSFRILQVMVEVGADVDDGKIAAEC